METVELALPEVRLLRPNVYEDERGYFSMTFSARDFGQLGLPAAFVQHNLSRSRRGTLRGVHYQLQHSQGKLVRCVHGQVFDVAVDLRRSSPTAGRWVGQHLTDERPELLWIPPGFGHGFYVLSEWADVAYDVTDYYSPEAERTVRWDDPTLGIEWPLAANEPPLLSAKDSAGVSYDQAELYD